MNTLFHIATESLFFYYLAAGLSYVVLIAVALIARPKHRFRLASVRLQTLKKSPFLAPVTVIVPARNEELTIVESVRALLDLDYPYLEIVVVNDGSADTTLSRLQEAYALRPARLLYVPQIATAPVRRCYLSQSEPHLTVIDKQNGGTKADAINAGLNAATGAFVCIVDADSIIEKDALLRIMAAVHTDTSGVIAAGGIVRVLNGSRVENGSVVEVNLPRTGIEVLQVIEYLRAFLIGRDGWARMDMLPLISGAFGLFRTSVLREIGGLNRTSMGEDLDLVVRLHRYHREKRQPCRIAFVPDPTCWTEVPRDLPSLGRQRARWQHGLIEVLWHNRDMLFRRRFGRIGAILLPYLWGFEVFAPLMELLGYAVIAVSLIGGHAEKIPLLATLAVGYAFSVLVSIGAILLEEITYRRYQSWRSVARLILYSFLEYAPYHQFTLWWRLQGMINFLRNKSQWAASKRVAFRTTVASTPSRVALPK